MAAKGITQMARKSTKKPKAVAPPRFDDYWQLRMEGATSRLKAAQKIVSHTGTRGSLAEALLRELIREFLPQRWGVGTGFIMSADRQRSNQVDVLIYDQFAASPIYRDGELVILSPKAAKVAVEVKSYLNKDEIEKAMNNIWSVKTVDSNAKGLIFSYDGVQATTFVEHVKNWERKKRAEVKASPPGRTRWPDRVFNMEQNFLMFPDPDCVKAPEDRQYLVAPGNDPIVRFFMTETLTTLGLDNLRPFMRADKTGNVSHTL
ncbi:MAG TPA: hypothetical protein PKG54_06325 [Phycisphaerae bacterium]|jgi:hypothetical protein|nr:hypothetical protein [Phycisphaerae bacterium]HOB74124.1 hypothetical protein [Phycisphaerae bacterium]HPU31084.1 hypothetical protein [Phycisphaerae bacterium]HXK87142.1 hypothetical protein [Phycisphaerae bacterium]